MLYWMAYHHYVYRLIFTKKNFYKTQFLDQFEALVAQNNTNPREALDNLSTV
jgi:hypothetical protein